jgi:hypothetical protein
MYDLVLEKKTGFMSTMPFEIFDNKGILFYDSTFTKHIAEGRPVRFNLPIGIYTYNGNFIKLESPIPVLNITLPLRERNIDTGRKYKIKWGENKNKCTIFYKEATILFDNSLLTLPLYVRYGIYYHELGHLYYKTEYKADFYGAKRMLELGFNPSQVGRVLLVGLSDKSRERKEKMIKMLTKNIG